MPDVISVESSPTPSSVPVDPQPSALDAAVKSKDFSAYQAAKRAEALGQDVPTVSPDAAGSAPAQPGDQAAPADAPQDVKTTGDKPVTPQKRGAETRKQQLDADIQARLRKRHEIAQEIAREEGRLAALRSQTQPADVQQAAPSPATAEPATDVRQAGPSPFTAADPEPQLSQFEADPQKYPDPYTAYMRALGRWEARQEFRQQEAARIQRETVERAQQTQAERETKFRQSIADAAKADPDLFETLSPDVLALRPFSRLAPGEAPSALNAIAEEIIGSDNPIGLMRHFSDHPEALQRCAQMTPAQLYREIGRIEAGMAAAAAAPAAPHIKTITDAPAPPTTLGARPADPVDPAVRAIQRKDFAAFREAKRREAMRDAGLTR